MKNDIPDDIPDDEDASRHLPEVLWTLKMGTGNDFSCYRENTLRRRVGRRMATLRLARMADYLAHLRARPSELALLHRELLIGVTRFFRDSSAFDALTDAVIAPLARSPAPIRIWVPACSTGQEAYSIAMLARHYLDRNGLDTVTRIFATDLDAAAIETARAGRYPESERKDIPDHLAMAYLRQEASGFRVKKRLREMVVFGVHDLLGDPPYSRMDLISCRNFMIYLKPQTQGKVLSLFHFALRRGGHLFLGRAESPDPDGKLFSPVRNAPKLYAKDDRTAAVVNWIGDGARSPSRFSEIRADLPLPGRETVERLLLERFAPTCLLVTATGEIVHIHGNTGGYLEPAAGAPSPRLLENARKCLRRPLSEIFRRAVENRRQATAAIPLVAHGASRRIHLTVLPVSSPLDHFAVVFQESPGPPLPARPATEPEHQGDGAAGRETARRNAGDEENHNLRRIRTELMETRRQLEMTVADLANTNHELNALNADLQSANEELASVNEELRTSKEELESANEELITMNAEMESHITSLTRLTNDLDNFLASTRMAIIFVDPSLNILRFTPETTSIIPLCPGDVGRPITAFVTQIRGRHIAEDARAAIESLHSSEREIQTEDGRHHWLRALPYRTREGAVEGAVLTITDITEYKRSAHALEKALEEKKILLREIHHRVKNNLQTICGLLYLESRKRPHPEMADALEGSIQRIRSMAMIHEHLYHSDDLGRIDFGTYVRKIAAGLMAAHPEREGRIHFELTADAMEMDLQVAIPLGLAVNELVVNALKHAFGPEREGCIRVALENGDGGAICLTVGDDGNGLPEDLDLENPRTLGLELVRDLVIRQLGGQVRIDRHPGATFRLMVPATG